MAATRRWLWVAPVLLASTVWADEVHMRSGGVVRGVIVEHTAEVVVIETGPGRVTLPLSRVNRLVEADSALGDFYSQEASLAPNDAQGYARLARWAENHGLATYGRQTWEQVLKLDPRHPEANAAVGRTYYDGSWMPTREAYRRQGYIPFEGGWVTPAEHEALLLERTERQLVMADRREAELRVREAEARAREAEARAREAETNAEQLDQSAGGIPYWWVLAGGSGGPIVGQGHPRPPTTGPDRPGHLPARPPSAVSAKPGRSIWGTATPARRPAAQPRRRSSSRSSRSTASIR